MRKYHLWTGALAVLVFLITGQFLRHHTPSMASLSESLRLMHRSRHIYILASALVNLMLGLYFQQHQSGWRRIAQTAGSCMLLLSPLLLIAAFALEPERGFREEMWWSSAGLYALFAGCMAHVISLIP